MRLPSALRIKASRDFARLKREGTSQPGRFLVLSVLQQTSAVPFQFGLVTTRKLGGAVVRNRIRRLLREVVRAHQKRIKPGVMMVIIARWRAPEASLQDLTRDWLKSAARAGILLPPDSPPA
jgi:ribonuclease P protein component